jgi:hypothetical protein
VYDIVVLHSKYNGAIIAVMAPRPPRQLQATTFRLDKEILEALDVVRERDGISASEQVRRALLAWLKEKGVPVTLGKPTRRRGK